MYINIFCVYIYICLKPHSIFLHTHTSTNCWGSRRHWGSTGLFFCNCDVLAGQARSRGKPRF